MASETAPERAMRTGELPKGLTLGVAPDGKTPIYIREKRPKGPWFRVKNPQYGAATVRAKDKDDAKKVYLTEKDPGLEGRPEDYKVHLSACRVAKVAD